MEEKAFKLFKEAWDRIKEGYLFDEATNQTFDYMIKNLWKSKYSPIIKADILKHFPAIFAHSKYSQNPPPLYYILISLKDNDILKEMQSLLLVDWIKSNASEDSTFQLLNFIETFSEKQVPIENFVNTIIKRISPTMHKDMIEALSHMITIQHPEFMSSFLKRFLKMADQDDTLLKNYVRMNGRKALLQLMQIATPEQMNKIFRQLKGAHARPRLKSLSADHWGVLPDEGIAIQPDFQNGDLIFDRKKKRMAKFISYMFWDEKHKKDYRGLPSRARIVYLNRDGTIPRHMPAADVDVLDLEKLELDPFPSH